VTPIPPPQPHYQIRVDDSVREIAVGDSLLLPVVVQDATGTPVPEPSVAWTSTNLSVATAMAGNLSGGRIVGVSPGDAVALVSSLGARAAVPVMVLPRRTATPPLVVDDFHVIAVSQTTLYPDWYYAPRLVLRDTSSAGGNAVIAVRFELPGFSELRGCATRREIPQGGRELLHQSQEDPEWLLYQQAGTPRIAGEAVAHLTVRTRDGTAATMTVTGPIVTDTLPSYDRSSVVASERLYCG
jgi:hypothetical protein